MKSQDFARIAILLLGGKGTRLGEDVPKQYRLVHGIPLFGFATKTLVHSPLVEAIVYVVPKGDETKVLSFLKDLSLDHKPYWIVDGGASREESLSHALLKLKELGISKDALLLCHDAARPNLTEQMIEANFEAATQSGAAVTAIPSKDSLVLSQDGVHLAQYLPRQDIWRLQTPQTYRFFLIEEAVFAADTRLEDYTDEGSLLVAKTKIAPAIVLGDESNYKVTDASDWERFCQEKR